MRFRWGDVVLGFHKVWMEQVRDCGVEHPVCVGEENHLQTRSTGKLALLETCGTACSQHSSHRPLFWRKQCRGLGRKGALAPVRGG